MSAEGTSGCVNGQDVLANGSFRSPMDVEVDCEEAVTAAHQDNAYVWTAGTIALSVAIFFTAGLAEIGGGWLVWQTVREGRPWWWAAVGSCVLIAYGFIPTLQPIDDFGRIYAVYGGCFIVMCYAWGYLLDGMVIDTGDIIGSLVALGGVAIAWFWPR